MRGLIAFVVFGLMASLAAMVISTATALSMPGGIPQKLKTSPLVVETAVARHSFIVEVADSADEHSIGMMYRTEMADDSGMLFEYLRPQRVGYWMKNTYIPLDIIFVGKDARITNIAHMTVPESLKSVRSDGPVLAVLELKGGRAKALGIGDGDLVRHRMFNNFEITE